MLNLSKRALERMESGDRKEESSDVNPLKDAMKEAYDAAQAGDFDSYFTAFSNALDIRLAEGHKDVPDDVEPYELSELDS